MLIEEILNNVDITILRTDDSDNNDTVHNFKVKIVPKANFLAIPVMTGINLLGKTEEHALNIMDFSTSIKNVKHNTEILLEKYNNTGELNIENDEYTCVNKKGNRDSIYSLHLCIVDKDKFNSRKTIDVSKHEVLVIYFKSSKRKQTRTENNISSNVLLRTIAVLSEYTHSSKKNWKIIEEKRLWKLKMHLRKFLMLKIKVTQKSMSIEKNLMKK